MAKQRNSILIRQFKSAGEGVVLVMTMLAEDVLLLTILVPDPFLRGRQKQIMYDVAVSIRSFGCKQLLFNGSS